EVLLKADGGLDRFQAFGGRSGFDQRPVDCQDVGRHQAGFDASQDDVAHHVGENAGSSPSLAGFDQRGSIRHGIVKVEAAKPPITGMHGDFLTQPVFGDVIEVAENKHAQRQLRIDGRPPVIFTVQMANALSNERKVHRGIQLSQEMVFGHKLLDGHHLKHAALRSLLTEHDLPPPAEHIRYCAAFSLYRLRGFSQRVQRWGCTPAGCRPATPRTPSAFGRPARTCGRRAKPARSVTASWRNTRRSPSGISARWMWCTYSWTPSMSRCGGPDACKKPSCAAGAFSATVPKCSSTWTWPAPNLTAFRRPS